MKKIFLTVLILFCISSFIKAQVSGYVFGDYFYKVAGDTINGKNTLGSTQYNKVLKDYQAFEIRRIYITFDHKISDDFSVRAQLEGNNTSTLPNNKFSVWLKSAYLSWKNLIPNASINVGLTPTPTWDIEETIWNFRCLEKTFLDMRSFGNGVDLGIALNGSFDDKNKFGYNFMIGNGTGQTSENNKFKKYYLSLYSKHIDNFTIQGYGDYEPNGLNDNNKITAKGFAAYQSKDLTIGVSVNHQFIQNAFGGGVNRRVFGLSTFAWVPLYKVKDKSLINAVARFDMYDPDLGNTTYGYKENFILIGLDLMPVENVHFIPNVWIQSYSNKESGVTNSANTDITARLTFYYRYK
jgi:hypothetical protein